MKKFFIKLAKPFFKKSIIEYVESDYYQQEVIKLVNEKVDLPNMTEEAEEKIYNQIYDTLQIAIVDMIEEI